MVFYVLVVQKFYEYIIDILLDFFRWIFLDDFLEIGLFKYFLNN